MIPSYQLPVTSLNITDGSKLSANFQFLWPPTAPGTQQTGINHFYSSIWIQQTALYGQERVSLDLWCQGGLMFGKSWCENQLWIPSVSMISAILPFDLAQMLQISKFSVFWN
jgi:hypothetical protein